MAQADSVPSSSRQLITGESANQSTSLWAVNLPAIRVQPVDRRYFIGGSDAPVIKDPDETLVLWIWRKKRVHVDLEDLSNCRWYAASTSQQPLGTLGLSPSRPPAFFWVGCSGTFFGSRFGSGAGIGTYASAHSTGCHRTSWSGRSHREG
jgi:hypothetical protein